MKILLSPNTISVRDLDGKDLWTIQGLKDDAERNQMDNSLGHVLNRMRQETCTVLESILKTQGEATLGAFDGVKGEARRLAEIGVKVEE